MLQQKRYGKKLHHIADTLQSLSEVGVRPVSVQFDERKVKVVLSEAPARETSLGNSFKYSWGRDARGRLYELHMLPMRDFNLVWRTYPQSLSLKNSRGHVEKNAVLSEFDGFGASQEACVVADSVPTVSKGLRLVAASSNEAFFRVVA